VKPLLNLQSIHAGHGALKVLHDISLVVDQGELVALVGANGAGKSTLLKVISGQIRPSSGHILFDEEIELTGIPAHEVVQLGVIHVPEGRQLFPNMTVYENLLVGGNNVRAKDKRKESLKWIYDLFPIISARKNQLANTLSGGEQQMLAIARGLMANPKVLLLDEPSLGLAPLIVEELFRVVKDLNQQGLTVLLVEQNVRLSLTISVRAYVIENGRITMDGPSIHLIQDEKVKKAFLGL
jgi:branched-chain amino acid transport system ATP-binding protein